MCGNAVPAAPVVPCVSVTITNNPAGMRADAFVDGAPAGHLDYAITRDPDGAQTWDLYSTVVQPAYGGRGIGSGLVESVVRDARAAGARIVPSCWFVRDWLERDERSQAVVP